MDFAKNMAGTAVGIGSIALVGESMKMLPREFGGPKRRKKGKNGMSPMIKGSANLLVGTALLGKAASMVNKL
jgi:hypothetical protein